MWALCLKQVQKIHETLFSTASGLLFAALRNQREYFSVPGYHKQYCGILII